MKLSPSLKRIFDGAIGAPVIIQTKRDTLSDLFPIINKLNLSFRKMPLFNMANTFLTTNTIDTIADLDIVEKIYIDWPIRIPEIPIGSAITDFITHPGVFGLGILRSNFQNRFETGDWVTTAQTRNFLGVEQAKADGVTGAGIKVAVVDSDSSLRAVNHRQLMGKNVERYTVRKAFQTDTNGHGSHVATTIGGTMYTPLPNIFVEGMAPNVQLMMIKCLLTPIGTGSTSDCIEALNMAFDLGADIVNLSLGSECKRPDEDPFIKAIDSLPEDKLVVAASGNEGDVRIGSPALANKALAVGAMDIRTGEKADFSNSGEELDFIMPGVDIFSGIARETLLDVTGKGPEGFSSLSGTSMATPHLTGMIALAMQLLRQYNVKPTVRTFREIGAKYGEPRSSTRGYGPLTYNMIKQYVKEGLFVEIA